MWVHEVLRGMCVAFLLAAQECEATSATPGEITKIDSSN